MSRLVDKEVLLLQQIERLGDEVTELRLALLKEYRESNELVFNLLRVVKSSEDSQIRRHLQQLLDQYEDNLGTVPTGSTNYEL